MKFRNTVWFSLLVFVCCLSLRSSFAEEPYIAFLEGLRNREYYDTALTYIDTLEKRSDLPADIEAVLPYQRAVTLLDSSRFMQNPEAQAEQLDLAQAQLETFVKNSPDHELVPVANTELARILLGKSQILIWKAKSPSNIENRAKFQQDARALISKAKEIFQKAHDAYEQEFKSYGTYIPEDERDKRAARERVEGLYMRAQLDLATSTYEEAQTYDVESDKYKELLRQASLEFEEIHSRYRSQFSGLYARTMQGKCFEEQGNIREALGIYDELLRHPGQSSGLKRLQHQVRQFRLICLNDESRKDYQLVIIEAEEWLREFRSFARTPTGLGIRWELAQSQESLAMDRTTPEADRSRLLRQALDNAREINRFAGPYKDVSNSMIQRVLVALDREPGDPEDFDTAFGTANTMLETIGELRNELKEAEKSGDKEQISKVQGDLDATLSETERMYRLALSLADLQTDASQINATRYRLAYLFYLQRKNYDTAVVGKYLSARTKDSDPAMALDAAYLSMAGLSQAFNDAPESMKDSTLQLMIEVCEMIATTWPDSDRATDARMEMGRIYRRNEKPLDAAKWYGQVPETVPQYGNAQMEAGQAYWNAYLLAVVNEENQSTPAELTEWQNKAAEHLAKGIAETQKGIPAENPTPDALVRAKVSLANIEIMRGNDGKAIEYLTTDPHSVVQAVAVAPGEKRPTKESEVKSTTFASLAYQHLLRAYIGAKQLDKAEEARAELEAIAGASGGEALTAVYIELGRELQNELERLKKQGDEERLAAVRSGFETFLNQMFQRTDGQTYSSLLWIAETYFGMAQGSEGSPQKANQYYSAAAKAYEEIIKRGSNPDFVDANRLLGVRLRLVNCKRQEGDFEAAETNIKQILEANPKALDAQIEAAKVYQAWGKADSNPEKFLEAVRGLKSSGDAYVWGWGNIANRLQMIIDGGQATPEYRERNREVQYSMAEALYQYAGVAGDQQSAEEQLKRTKYNIESYASLTPGLPETEWWDKFDELYQEVQMQLGEAAVPLTKPTDDLMAGANPEDSDFITQDEREAAITEKQPPADTQKKEPGSSLMTYIGAGVFVLLALGVIGYTLMKGGKPQKRKSRAEMVAATGPVIDPVAASSRQPSKPTAAKKRKEAPPEKPKTQPTPTAEKKVRPPMTKEEKIAELKRRKARAAEKAKRAAQAEEEGKKQPRKKRPPNA